MIRLEDVLAYHGATQALFGVDLTVRPGETVALVGTNGAGKSTTIRAILGSVRTAGVITISDEDVSRRPTYQRVRRHRLAVVHEGRGLLKGLTVHENLVVGADRSARSRVNDVIDLFPALAGRLADEVSLLSGGQQQMVALGRALVRRPDYLMMDEPALGLAPSIIDEIYHAVAVMCSGGMGVLLVEQSVPRAASVADRLCLVRLGIVVRDVETADQSAVDGLVTEAFDLDAASFDAR